MTLVTRWRTVELPPPQTEGLVAVERAVAGRRSVREFADKPIELSAVSNLLWAAQGVTSPDGRRAAPSAGARYPLTLYLVSGRVTGLPQGVWRYAPEPHALQPHRASDCRAGLGHAALRQHWIRNGAVILLVAAAFGGMVRKYGARGERYACVEAGCAAENAWLQARALGLDAAMVGAFVDGEVRTLVGVPADEEPLVLLAIGLRDEQGAGSVGAAEAGRQVDV